MVKEKESENRGEGKRMASSSGEWFLAIFPFFSGINFRGVFRFCIGAGEGLKKPKQDRRMRTSSLPKIGFSTARECIKNVQI